MVVRFSRYEHEIDQCGPALAGQQCLADVQVIVDAPTRRFSASLLRLRREVSTGRQLILGSTIVR